MRSTGRHRLIWPWRPRSYASLAEQAPEKDHYEGNGHCESPAAAVGARILASIVRERH